MKKFRVLCLLLIMCLVVSCFTVIGSANTVSVSGTLKPGYTLTATESGDWYRCDDASGTNQASVATSVSTYTLVNADGGKYIKFSGTSGVTYTAQIDAPLSNTSAYMGYPGVAAPSGQDTGLQATTPTANRFKVDGKTFILLDVDADGTNSKYLAMTVGLYGTHAFDTAGAIIIDPTSSTNISYWFDNVFKTSGNNSVTLPTNITNNIDYNHEWLTEAIGTAVPNDYVVKAGINLLSVNEFIKYKSVFGLDYPSFTATQYLRTPWCANNGKLTCIATFGNNIALWSAALPTTANYIRPCFWLDEDFFSTVKLSVDDLGANVKSAIVANNARSAMKSIYTDNELLQLGYEPEISSEITATDLSVKGTYKPGYTVTAAYTYSDTNSIAEGNSSVKWYLSTDADKTDSTEVATGKTFTVTNACANKYISFGVMPQNETGVYGTEVVSSAVLVGSALQNTTAFMGYPSTPPYSKTTGIQDTTPSENKFKVGGKSFILLDTDENGTDSKYFAMTLGVYGAHAFDTANSPVFNSTSSTNIAYWLNNDFKTNGNNGASLPEKIINNIDYSHAWLTESAGSIIKNDYFTTAGLSIMSLNEFMSYKDKFGWDNDSIGMLLRTPWYAGDSNMTTVYNKRWGTATPDNTAQYIRPCFWLNGDFFKTVAIDNITTAGANVLSAISNSGITLAEAKALYPDVTEDALMDLLGWDNFRVNSISYKSGVNDITALQGVASLDITANIQSYYTDLDVVMISAIYNQDGDMINIAVSESTPVTVGTLTPITLSVDLLNVTIPEGSTMKTLFWSDMYTMKPYVAAVDF